MKKEKKTISMNIPIKWFYDNKITTNISQISGTILFIIIERKHIKVNQHFTKEKVKEGAQCMTHATTSEQMADVSTKQLGRSVFERLMGKLGMLNIFFPT